MHSDKEAESEEPQEKAKAQGAPKIEEEEQDLKVMQVCARETAFGTWRGQRQGAPPSAAGLLGALAPPPGSQCWGFGCFWGRWGQFDTSDPGLQEQLAP